MADLIVTSYGQIKTGTDAADFFTLQTGGFVKVYGLAGDDTVFANDSVGNTYVSSDSFISMAGGADSVYIASAIYSSNVTLGAGGDTVTTDYWGDATVNGGDGNDVVNLGSAAWYSTFNLGAGADKVSGATERFYSSVVNLGAGSDTLTILASAYNNTINGGGGADVITLSGSWDNTITGGAGTDVISNSNITWSSVIQGGGNADTITLASAGEDNTVNGGAGADLITFAYSDSNITETAKIYGDGGSDTINVDGADWAWGMQVYGGDGADSITLVSATVYGNNTITGGLGADTINFAGNTILENLAYENATESNIDSYDVVNANSARILAGTLDVDGLSAKYNFGTDATPFKTNANALATFKAGTSASLSDRLQILDDNTDRGAAVLFDATDANGFATRYLFIQGGNSSASDNSDDYLVQVDAATRLIRDGVTGDYGYVDVGF